MRYVLYLSGLRPIDDFRRAFVPIFEDITLAKAFIITFMGNEPVIPKGNELTWGENYTLRTSHLADILAAYEGVLPDMYSRQILQFKYGNWESKPKPKDDGTTTSNDGNEKAPSLTRIKRPARPTGYVTITELATTWGIPALHARAALRASDRVKPPYGWAFDPKEVPAIKKLCMQGMPV